jgi:hypothetical protein
MTMYRGGVGRCWLASDHCFAFGAVSVLRGSFGKVWRNLSANRWKVKLIAVTVE